MLLAILGFGVAWMLGYFRGDPRLAEIERLRAEIDDNGGGPRDPKNRELFDEMQQKREQLPPELRGIRQANAGGYDEAGRPAR